MYYLDIDIGKNTRVVSLVDNKKASCIQGFLVFKLS